MKLVHPDGGEVDCHPSQIENMKNFGWIEPSEKKAPKGKKAATKTDEVIDNG